MSNNPIVQQLFSSSDDAKKKKKLPPKPVANPYENPFDAAFKGIGKGVFDSLKNNAQDIVKKDIKKQLFGGGDMKPGQEISFAQQKHQMEQQKTQENKPNIRPAMDYVGEILKAGENASAKESQEVKQEIQNLIMEIKQLGKSARELESQVVEATGHAVVKPGKYHKSFFRFVLSIIRDAKAKIDSAGTWLSAMKGKQKKGMAGGKQKKKSNYWDMAKKHGSQFTLSGERAVSNQVG